MPTVASRPSPSLSVDPATTVVLPRDSNQALGIGRFAVDFMGQKFGKPSQAVLDRTRLFHADSVLCGLSALALRTNAPTLLRNEALEYPKPRGGAPVFGSKTLVAPEKAIAANSAAVREWDSNGTNFGYNPKLDHSAGEFGHNDFYPVAVAAAQIAGRDGPFALRGMVLLDEIRGRLAEVFSLKSYKIDHVVHGAIASAATYARAGGHARADRIGHRHVRGALHSVAGHPRRQATQRLQGPFGRHFDRSRHPFHAAGHEGFVGPARHLPQS